MISMIKEPFVCTKGLKVSAKYIIRLDDASHQMDFKKWKMLEEILDNHNINPVVAVVPQNKDPEISFDSYNQSFWELIASWQNKNWAIAMHGFQHTFHFISRWKLILPFYHRSEFAGLALKEQELKISKSLKIFNDYQIHPTVWIAPGHCFDKNTVKALHNITEINYISDGIAFQPYRYLDMTWIPQQLWRLEPKGAGVWTVCLHPNTMSIDDITQFERSLLTYKDQIINISDVSLSNRHRNLADYFLSFKFWLKYNFFIVYRKFKFLFGIT
jgi:predicted deacetylase